MLLLCVACPPTLPPLPSPQAVPHLFVDMAEALGLGTLPAERAVPAVLAAIRQLSSDVGIPKNLKALVSWQPYASR